jgi:two-component system LytT family response regulator
MKNNDLINIGGYEKISPTNIMMLKADSNYTVIHLVDGKQILSSTNIGILEKRLKDFLFFRPNRSVIINLEFMSAFVNKEKTGDCMRIRMKNDTDISISGRRAAEFLKIVQ